MSEANKSPSPPAPRGYSTRKISPLVEMFEPRVLLSGVIAGTVFLDAANDHVLDASDAYIPGATVQLFQVGGATPIAFQTTDAQGGYAFSNLPAGHYLVKETPPQGSQPTGAQALSQIEPPV
jgi:hypothetical protein